jgi:hypothetical protein
MHARRRRDGQRRFGRRDARAVCAPVELSPPSRRRDPREEARPCGDRQHESTATHAEAHMDPPRSRPNPRSIDIGALSAYRPNVRNAGPSAQAYPPMEPLRSIGLRPRPGDRVHEPRFHPVSDDLEQLAKVGDPRAGPRVALEV